MNNKFKLKVKVLYEYNYKDYDHYQMAVERWIDKGWFFVIDQISSKENENYTLLAYDGYNR